jgi:hypothetical protein
MPTSIIGITQSTVMRDVIPKAQTTCYSGSQREAEFIEKSRTYPNPSDIGVCNVAGPLAIFGEICAIGIEGTQHWRRLSETTWPITNATIVRQEMFS